MIKFINENLKYPKEALENKVEGTVKLEYVIDGQGKIVKVKILKGIGFGCDDEAIRLVKSLVFEKAYNRGLNTRTKRSLQIHFKLPKKTGVKMQYQLVSKKSETKQPTPPKSRTYQITVNIPSKK